MMHEEGRQLDSYVGFEVSTAVIMKIAVFWDVAPCAFIINTFRRYMSLPSSG
jgi:hypothetical protein